MSRKPLPHPDTFHAKAAVGWLDMPIMSAPAASAAAVSSWVLVAVSVRGSGGILGIAALIACLFPAYRATTVNPVEALRAE